MHSAASLVAASLLFSSVALGAATFTHGPVVGGVHARGARIFLRTDGPARVALELSLTPTFDEPVMTPERMTEPESDYTVHIPVNGLESGTRYYYTARINGERINPRVVPTFRTSPSNHAIAESFRFAVTGDAEPGAYWGARSYWELAKADPAFVIQLGDFDHRNPAQEGEEPNIESWRVMHRDMLRDSLAGRDFFRYIGHRFPCYPMWDDHDYGDNNADKNAPWKNIALQAFREYHPLPPLPAPEQGLWYKFRYAQAEFFVLDLRSQRDSHLDPDGLEKSMLDGNDVPGGQLDWLLESLLASTATWKFILSTVPFNPTVGKPDAWTSYATERSRILHFLDTQDITGVITISADIHSGGGIDDGFYAGIPEMTVPHLNLNHVPESGCTALDCGLWSHGITDGSTESSTNAGYGIVQVGYDETNGHEVVLKTRSHSGDYQHSLRLHAGDLPGDHGMAPREPATP